MKSIEVSAAVICKNNKIFVTRRGYGEFKGFWEFPGGKLEPNETKEAALVRELYEELKIKSEAVDFIGTTEYDYEKFHLKMHLFLTKMIDEPTLIEHMDSKWIELKDIDKYIKNDDPNMVFLPADVDAFKKIKAYFEKSHDNRTQW